MTSWLMDTNSHTASISATSTCDFSSISEVVRSRWSKKTNAV